eukprot:CAMPEP_0184746566 /NCGR_PEP_ID=MMETSP0315-20130426/9087_1 /TAXON_ID=101924 /ORGANISM="Rhodosorus marinus, Strain UTEX LB 2760" /LENGTH=176 /DNA_ID=CAMNT_0027219201 /DNA_START=2060 /DNA_END=2590 /DNA_ORIENTATION=+
MTTNLTEGSLNSLDISKKSTLYTFIAEKGPIAGFQSHDDPARMPLPPFNEETALQKVKAAENAWNTKDPEKVCLAYTPDTVWRNRDHIFCGRDEVKRFLSNKWEKEQDYKLVKNLWCYSGNRIGARFTYEYRLQGTDQWYRCHGNELWEFDGRGYMMHRDMSGNDIPIDESDRLHK